MSDLLASFGKPFAYQVAAYRLRLMQMTPTMKWDDIWQGEHDRAFMVAGAMKVDVLADLAAMVDRAIAEGGTLEDFRRDFRAMVAEKGWQISPAGQGTKGGEAWRTKVIYKTNMATSYAAGRMAQLRAGGYKFYVYRHGNSLEPRLHHLAWDGLVLPADHPFWDTHAPPNGWGCKCRIMGARSKEFSDVVGGKPEKELPDNWDKIDPKTGAPKGIDRGWAYAPSASVTELVANLVPKLDALPERPSIDLIQSWLRMDAFAAWMSAPIGFWPVARISEASGAAIGAETRIASLSVETMAKQVKEHPELTGLDYLMVQRTIDAATIIVQDTPQSLIFVLEDKAAGYVLVVKATQSGKGLFVTSFRRLSADQVKRDEAIRRLLRKQMK
jgi:hypothetical protein